MRRSWAAGTAAIAAAALGATLAGPAMADSTVTLAGSAAPAASTATDLGAVPASTKLHIEVWLTPNLAGAQQFANEVSSPGNALYHQYLTPAQYTAQYGASASQAQAVASWLTSEGFRKVQVGAQRDSVTATGSAATVDTAFAVEMDTYQLTGADGGTQTVTTNNQALSIPSALSSDVLSVTGLDSMAATTYHTATRASSTPPPAKCSQYWGQHTETLSPAVDGISKAGLSVCGYSADQLRAAYGATNANTGTGVTIALIEDGAPTAMFQTLTDYAAANGLPAPTSTQLRQLVIGQGAECGNPFDVEEQLDSEAAYAMAPGATQLMVEGDSCNEKLEGVQPLFDADNVVLDGNGNSALASEESNSWGINGGESYPAVYAATAHAIDLRAAAEGVGMYFSAGDDPGISVPASDPYTIAVGGTTLGLGAQNQRLFETGWSNHDFVQFGKTWYDQGIPRDASGGGASLLYGQPSWQAAVVPVSMSTVDGRLDRTVPDLSADADPNTGILEGTIEEKADGTLGRYKTFVDGGTSLAAPLVAGLVADAQQGQAQSFGFISPLLYSLAGSAAFNDALPITSATPAIDQASYATRKVSIYGANSLSIFDSQIPQYTDQVTAVGYDTMTGLGTPNGSAFLNALRGGS